MDMRTENVSSRNRFSSSVRGRLFSTNVLQTFSIVCLAVAIVFGVIGSIQRNVKTRIKI